MIPTLRRLFVLLSFGGACLAQEPAPATPAAAPSTTPKLVVGLYDVQGLWGGNNVEVFSNDKCIVSRYTRPKGSGVFHILKFEAQLPAGESQKLLRLADSTKFLEYREERKAGVPDEAHPRIKIPVENASPFEVSKWAGEKSAKFDPLYKALLEIAQKTRPGKVLHDGPEKEAVKKR
jgi:hypothetical protein